MIVKPVKTDTKILNHSNPKADLLDPFYTLGDEPKYEEGDLRSLRIILQLPKSSYATMAIR